MGIEDLDLVFVGDIHGELKELVWRAIYQYKLKDTNIVVLGDFGVGFNKPAYIEQLYKKLEPKLLKNNLTIYTIRGNHDDPIYFDGKHDFDRLIFLKDYIPVEISGSKILPIGGAVSIDQKLRKVFNEKMEKYGSSKRSWWPDEGVTKISEKELPSSVDIIISHCAPISFEPIYIRNDFDRDLILDTWMKILDERNYLEKTVKNNVRFKYWFFGHYHRSVSGNYGDMLYRGLDIMEFYYYWKEN